MNGIKNEKCIFYFLKYKNINNLYKVGITKLRNKNAEYSVCCRYLNDKNRKYNDFIFINSMEFSNREKAKLFENFILNKFNNHRLENKRLTEDLVLDEIKFKYLLSFFDENDEMKTYYKYNSQKLGHYSIHPLDFIKMKKEEPYKILIDNMTNSRIFCFTSKVIIESGSFVVPLQSQENLSYSSIKANNKYRAQRVFMEEKKCVYGNRSNSSLVFHSSDEAYKFIRGKQATLKTGSRLVI